MTNHKNLSESINLLRVSAEKLLKTQRDCTLESPSIILELIDEIDTRYAELKTRNEELKQAHHALTEIQQEYEHLYEKAPCGYMTLCHTGSITRMNSTGAKLLDLEKRRQNAKAFSLFVDAGCRNAYFDALKKCGETGGKQSLELKLIKTNNDAIWALTEIQADPAKKGFIKQWRLTFSDITEQVILRKQLQKNERKYRLLFRQLISGAVLFEITRSTAGGQSIDGRILEANPAFERLTGIDAHDAVGSRIGKIRLKSGQSWSDAFADTKLACKSIRKEVFFEMTGKHVLVTVFRLDVDRAAAILTDISPHKQLEEILASERTRLETELAERTVALQKADLQLATENASLKEAQNRLLQKTEELKNQSASLVEANSALKVLLQQRESDRLEIEERVRSNMNELIWPTIRRLAAIKRNKKEQLLFEVLQRNLEDITSPLVRRLIIETRRFTPTETQVADLIRQGRTTKEIAMLLGVAVSTIDFHRLNIRRKLNLTNRSLNLQTYLNSLT